MDHPQNPIQQDSAPQQMNAPTGHPQPQQMPQQPTGISGQPMSPMQQTTSGSNGLAIAALVLGIIALLTSWTIIGGILLGLVGLVLGIIAIVQKQGTMAIVGVVLSVLAIFVAIAFIFFAADIIEKCENDAAYRAANVQRCVDLGL